MIKSTKTKAEKRSFNMQRIKSADTTIEADFRKALWREGIRYRKNYKLLPGKPDIVITKYRIAIFCDGEFWHGKDWDTKKPKIKDNREYWVTKIERNIGHDNEVNKQLQNIGWTVLRFWGQDIHKNMPGCIAVVLNTLSQTKT